MKLYFLALLMGVVMMVSRVEAMEHKYYHVTTLRGNYDYLKNVHDYGDVLMVNVEIVQKNKIKIFEMETIPLTGLLRLGQGLGYRYTDGFGAVLLIRPPKDLKHRAAFKKVVKDIDTRYGGYLR